MSDETIKPFQDLVESRLKILPRDKIAAEGLITLMLMLMSVLMVYQRDHQSSQGEATKPEIAAHFVRVKDLVERFVADTSKLIPEEDSQIYRVVEREAILRLKPLAQSPSFGSLFSNQKVREIEKRHKWIAVEYFDEIAGVSKSGWALKKYFKYTSKPNKTDVDELSAIKENWDKTNDRRVSLIKKRIEGKLSTKEELELEHLQQLADRRMNLLAPLPVEQMRSVLNDLTRST